MCGPENKNKKIKQGAEIVFETKFGGGKCSGSRKIDPRTRDQFSVSVFFRTLSTGVVGVVAALSRFVRILSHRPTAYCLRPAAVGVSATAASVGKSSARQGGFVCLFPVASFVPPCCFFFKPRVYAKDTFCVRLLCAYTRMYPHMHVCIQTYKHTNIRTQTRMDARIRNPMLVCMYACINDCVCVCGRVYVCVYRQMFV